MWQVTTTPVTTKRSHLPLTENRVLDKLLTTFRSLDPEADQYPANLGIYFEEIAFQILAQGPAGLDLLLEELTRADFVRLRGILAALGRAALPSFQLRELFRQYLKDQRVLIVAEAIDGLTHLKDKEASPKVLPFLSHSSPYIRASVLRYLSRLYSVEAKEILMKSLGDPHYIVRENAVDELADLGITEAIPQIKLLLQDVSAEVRQAAETAIKELQEYVI
jgi:HEAT repeat protein